LSSMVGISGKLRRVMLKNRFYIKHDWDFLVAQESHALKPVLL